MTKLFYSWELNGKIAITQFTGKVLYYSATSNFVNTILLLSTLQCEEAVSKKLQYFHDCTGVGELYLFFSMTF